MKIFVTGGSGFIGGHVIEVLAAEHSVVAMARSDRSAERVTGYGAEPVRCALDTIEPAHLDGVDAVVHCAAFVEEWGTREQFWSANVDGTTRVLEAARAAGVGRFIHVGTEAALFDGHDLVEVDETQPYPVRHRFYYSESKAEAERRVLAANSGQFHTVSIRPRMVWGPRDTTVLPVVLRMIDSGQWRWIDGGRPLTSVTHVRNLVEGIRLALDRGEGGNAYFVVDAERSTIRQMITELAATQHRTPPDASIPSALARPVAWAVDTLWGLLRLSAPPPMTHFAVSMMASTVTICGDKAREELGYEPVVSREAGLAELAEMSSTTGAG